MTHSSLPGSPVFATTKWTLVHAIGRDGTVEAQRALAELCESYWYPLYAFVRRKGFQAAEAQDITQSFFTELLEKGRLQLADETRGRFRTFLLAALQNFLANHVRDGRALKRGGGHTLLTLDFDSGEDRYSREPAHEATPERIFERRWANALLDQAVRRLREEFEESNRAALFDALAPYLGGDNGASYEAVAKSLGTTEGSIKVAVHRFRKRCRELLRAEIAQTVSSAEDVDDELRALFQAVEST